ncbi:MAG: hypothetical protein PHN69_05365 [Candidatus Pacebacteria bacterium]|nr:hypothetical protein [Candidatus Paceibacterota bacterium]
MAKNYTYAEAVAIIAEGKDLEAIMDLGRRYPVLVQKTTVVATKAGEDFVELMSFMPEYLTANKVNTSIKKAVTETEADSDSEEEDVDAADETSEDANEGAETDYDSMTAKELWDILGKAGKRGTAKSKKKVDLVEAVKALANGGAEEADEDEGEEEEAGKYDGKSAVELFKECKARKIKAEPKKPAKYYVDLLTKADAAAEETEDEDADDNWDDEEDTGKKTTSKATNKKAPAKTNKKAEADDDGDDWDI